MNLLRKEIKIKDLKSFLWEKRQYFVVSCAFVVALAWVIATSTPLHFRVPTTVDIEKGETLKQVASKLKQKDLINSEMAFNAIMIILGHENKIVAGEYAINEKLNIFSLIDRLVKGDYAIGARSVTLSEGLTVAQMANILDDSFGDFDKDAFLEETKDLEGFLFPDTYFFPKNADNKLILDTLINTFNKKLREHQELIENSPYTLEEIIIMASIIEKESTAQDKQEISNILWKRIAIDMPLQVDATFVYERGLGTFDLTKEDLTTDSEYNTYTRKGLPPTPIANPGIESIVAAAQPQETDYLFFLTGADGKMYYAENFAMHKQNKARYLR